jgi:hypothetical protein
MPKEKRCEIRLVPLEKAAGHKCKKAGEQKKNNDKHVRHRRREISRKLALGYRFDVSNRTVHCASSFASDLATVSG